MRAVEIYLEVGDLNMIQGRSQHLSAVIASSKKDKYGAQVLTLSYTGTTKEAAEASRQSRLFSEAEDSNFESQIRDHTGSGYEHFPEDQAPEQVRKELGNSALAADTPIIALPSADLEGVWVDRLQSFVSFKADTCKADTCHAPSIANSLNQLSQLGAFIANSTNTAMKPSRVNLHAKGP